jgi:hypothetical protein
VVAESDTGEITAVDPRTGTTQTLLSGLYSPQGVDYDDGLLFVAVDAAAWSIAGQMGKPAAGQVVRAGAGAFTSTAGS